MKSPAFWLCWFLAICGGVAASNDRWSGFATCALLIAVVCSAEIGDAIKGKSNLRSER